MIYLDQLLTRRDVVDAAISSTSLEEAWGAIESFFSVKKEQTFVFVSSGAEAIAQIFKSVYVHEVLPTGLNHLLTSEIEEAPILMGLEGYNKLGALVDSAQMHGQTRLTRQTFEPYITPYTKLISMSAACVQTGVMHDIKGIAELAKEKGVLFHVDASHLVGLKPISIEALGADYISIDGTKCEASGSGALIAAAGRKVEPLILDYQGQSGYRGGVFDIERFSLFSRALEAHQEVAERFLIHLPAMQRKFEKLLAHEIEGCKVCFNEGARLPFVSVIQIEGIFNELLAFYLERAGVQVSLGGGSLQQMGSLFSKVGVTSDKVCELLTLGWGPRMDFETLKEAIDIIKRQVARVRSVHTGEGALW